MTSDTTLLDCDQGRCMGCQTYCCKLLIRITEEERTRIYPQDSSRRFIDKDVTTGYCEFLDLDTQRCGIFDKRPAVCREYTCNDDKILQVALTHDDKSMVELIKLSWSTFIPIGLYKKVPKIGD